MRLIKYALKNVLRNKFLSLSSILVLTLLMFFINILFVLHDVSFQLIGQINSKLNLSLYLDEEYDKNDIEVIDLIESIQDISPSIEVEYRTKEQILDDIQLKDPDLAKILERSNPLPDTISIGNIALDDYEQVNHKIENQLFLLSKDESDDQYFANYTTQYKKIVQIISVLNILQLGLYVIIAIFVISISVIIYSVIGNFIYYYKDEIYITRLVGGAKQFIYGPFALQGIFYSFVSFLCSLGVFLLILQNVNTVFKDLYVFRIDTILLLAEGCVFVIIGGISGLISSQKYVK